MPIAIEPPCVQSKADGFIRSANTHLCLGGKELSVLGANSYGILGGYLGIGYINNQTEASPARLIDASNNGLQVIRFWLDMANSDYWFQRAYSKYLEEPDHSSYFSALDKLVSDAKANRVNLIPVFGSAYDQWTQAGNGDSFWQIGSKTNVLFKEWVTSIVRRYANETQIAWWEASNEPNYPPTRVKVDTYTTWAADIYGLIKSIDPNHLVSGGINNTGDLDYGKFGKFNEIFDIATIHIYVKDIYRLEAAKRVFDKDKAIFDFVQSYSTYAKSVLQKPLVFEEFNGDNLTNAGWFVEKFLSYALSHGNGALIWSWEEGDPKMTRYVSPSVAPLVVNVLRAWSTRLKN